MNIKGDKLLPLEKKKNNSSHDSSPDQKSSSVGAAAWETLVIFAVNFKRLNVHMNMGNVMGNVTYVYSICLRIRFSVLIITFV